MGEKFLIDTNKLDWCEDGNKEISCDYRNYIHTNFCTMGYVYAAIELTNSGDIALARRNYIKPEEVKRMTVNMLVDSGAYSLCINESIQQQLDLPFIEKRKVEMTNGSIEEFDVVGPVGVRFKNRGTVCYALVLPGSSEPLLGSIPLLDMDVVIDSKKGELIVHPDHPNYTQVKVK